MRMIILVAVSLLLFVTSLNGKRLYNENDENLEITDKKARMFLRSMIDDSDDSAMLDTRQAQKQCTPCKFNIAPCCSPNYCRKKFLRPDECVEVKQGK
ncbi:hypothetical protein I4U23_005016 [Adineta vaga]|nr:hypothetical protein I4U23_005016 [Adineta vaga]